MQHPFSIETFRSWCLTQPEHRRYCYDDCYNCAFAQYLRSIGLDAHVQSDHWRLVETRKSYPLPPGLNDAVAARPWTFGALAARLGP